MFAGIFFKTTKASINEKKNKTMVVNQERPDQSAIHEKTLIAKKFRGVSHMSRYNQTLGNTP